MNSTPYLRASDPFTFPTPQFFEQSIFQPPTALFDENIPFFFEPESGMGQAIGSDEPFDILPPEEF